METRESDTNERLAELLEQLASAEGLDRVPVDQVPLMEAMRTIIEANVHAREAAGD